MARARRSVAPREVALRWLDLEGEQFALFEWPITTSAPTEAAPAPPPPSPTLERSCPDSGQPEIALLSPAECAVLAYVTRGHSNAEIALARKTSARTVANQVARLLRKLGASSRFDLIRRFGRG